ncbi:hypothetical protein C7M84_004044 [Penaeus vannamei]|uniref:Uncharacterized protein n=1 Tax=Penaeus vannamei TaxID=6689 RepID=A0A3R7PFY1_PENVA|nr:hypothetical protein C7M84_004044 [Penaeus vannamei]
MPHLPSRLFSTIRRDSPPAISVNDGKREKRNSSVAVSILISKVGLGGSVLRSRCKMPNEQKRGARESHLLTRDKPRKPTETALCKPEKKVVPRQNLKPEKGNPNIPSGCIRYIETREQTHGSLQQKQPWGSPRRPGGGHTACPYTQSPLEVTAGSHGRTATAMVHGVIRPGEQAIRSSAVKCASLAALSASEAVHGDALGRERSRGANEGP